MSVDFFWAVGAVFMREIGSGRRCGCGCLIVFMSLSRPISLFQALS